ncbi:MAG: nuclear transport factor 2 family protein [Chloroflexi bacterium]|nr:nuclear transport factor 2 family protein [Chloroflexota bacterium]
MEIVRCFIAAFASRDKDTLDWLLSPTINYQFYCDGIDFQGFSRDEVSGHILRQRELWIQSRVDIKSWQIDGQVVTVKFHVQRGKDIYTDFLEYVVRLVINAQCIEMILVQCATQHLDSLPVWLTSLDQMPNSQPECG